MLEAFYTLAAFCAVFVLGACLDELVRRRRQRRSADWIGENGMR